MQKTVQFDRQLRISAIEIQNVAHGKMLSSKLEAGKLTSAQGLPKLFFFLGLIPAKLPSGFL